MNYATSRTVARVAPPRSSLSSSAAIKSRQERRELKNSRTQEWCDASFGATRNYLFFSNSRVLEFFTASPKWATNDNQMRLSCLPFICCSLLLEAN